MPDLIIQLIILLLVCGFCYWIWTLLVPYLAKIIAEPFLGLVNILVMILFAAIILFYAIIPLIRAFGHMKFF